MRRRDAWKPLLAAPAVLAVPAAEANPIQLHVDLEVEPAKQKQLMMTFRNTFRPAISRQPGFVDVKLMKLRKEIAGKAPKDCTYRLLISFQTEEQRQKWVATDLHQKVWPEMEKSLKGSKYLVLLYDIL